MAASNFRQRFMLQTRLNKWFPGHMVQGMRKMQNKLTDMDLLIEVHDARIPLSGRNPSLRETLLGAKPHILLLNKKDLVDQSYNETVISKLQNQGIDKIIYTDLMTKKTEKSGFEKILPSVIKLVRSTDRYNRSDRPEINVMVIGIPNVGKSCLINRIRRPFRKGSPAQVGGNAGVTRCVMEKIKLSSDPLVYILDTPGILEPKINNVDTYMKLALCSSMSDDVVGIEVIADYALYWLNKNRTFSYMHHFDLEGEPSDNISEVLMKIAIKTNQFLKYRDMAASKIVPRPNLKGAAAVFVKAFRTGDLGKVMLDLDIMKKQSLIVTDPMLPFEADHTKTKLPGKESN